MELVEEARLICVVDVLEELGDGYRLSGIYRSRVNRVDLSIDIVEVDTIPLCDVGQAPQISH